MAAQVGAKPPSSPTAVGRPFLSAASSGAWKISAPQRRASRKEVWPTGMIMNSWMSRLLLAWAPPLMMFIIGTGICIGPGTAKVAVERQAGFLGGGLGDRHRNGQDGVGARRDLLSVPSGRSWSGR